LSGSVSYAVEIYDAGTNRLLGAYVSKQYPNAMNVKASIGGLGAAKAGIRKGAEEEAFAIVGGFVQVRPDKVVVMAETADLASDIDLEKAQEARREAERALEGAAQTDAVDLAAARAQLQQALLRIRVAERRHREGPRRRG